MIGDELSLRVDRARSRESLLPESSCLPRRAGRTFWSERRAKRESPVALQWVPRGGCQSEALSSGYVSQVFC